MSIEDEIAGALKLRGYVKEENDDWIRGWAACGGARRGTGYKNRHEVLASLEKWPEGFPIPLPREENAAFRRGFIQHARHWGLLNRLV